MSTLLYKLTLSFLLTSAAVLVSRDTRSQDTKEKEIIIRKKAGSDDKMTIVIDGDKVTMNGKDITELGDINVDVDVVQRNVDLMQRKAERMQRNAERAQRNLERMNWTFRSGEGFAFAPAPPMPPMPPTPPGVYAPWADTILFESKARLGVYTEKNDRGARITEVVDNSPAKKAGLAKDDIIVAVGKTDITDPSSLSEAIGNMKAGDEVEIKYIRGKKQQKVTAKLDSHSRSAAARSFYFNDLGDKMAREFEYFGENWNRPQLGIRIQDTEEGKGVKVLDLEPESLAAKAGIEKDDLVTAIDGNEINSTDDARRELSKVKVKSAYTVRLLRKGTVKEVEIKVPKKLKTTNL